VHHKLEELLDEYLKITGLEKEPESPLFPAAIGKTGKLSRRPLVRTDAADMLKRRFKQAGLQNWWTKWGAILGVAQSPKIQSIKGDKRNVAFGTFA
jgi:hypothetical protein